MQDICDSIHLNSDYCLKLMNIVARVNNAQIQIILFVAVRVKSLHCCFQIVLI